MYALSSKSYSSTVSLSSGPSGVSSISYLGNIFSSEGVAMDPPKVQAISDWPQPRSVRAVRGFLGLAGYYRKFVQNYGTTTAPLTALLREEGFS